MSLWSWVSPALHAVVRRTGNGQLSPRWASDDVGVWSTLPFLTRAIHCLRYWQWLFPSPTALRSAGSSSLRGNVPTLQEAALLLPPKLDAPASCVISTPSLFSSLPLSQAIMIRFVKSLEWFFVVHSSRECAEGIKVGGGCRNRGKGTRLASVALILLRED